jgi:hypothetical protein
MATSGALGGFLQAMLQLRAQRLQEEEAKQRASQAGMSALMSGISGAASSIMGGLQSGAENKMYNQLSQEAFGGGGGPTVGNLMAGAPGTSGTGIARPLGRLGAADTSAAPSDFTLPATSTPNRYTGGKAEFDARMKMLELRDKIDRAKATDLRAGTYLDLAQQRNIREQAAATRAANKDSYLNQLFQQAPKDAKEIIQKSMLYQTKVPDLVEKQRKAMFNNDYEGYQNYMREHQAYNTMATNSKLSTDLIPVEPYVSRDMAEKFAALSEAQAAAQGGGTRQQRDLQAAQQDVTGMSSPIPPRLPPYSKLDPGLLNRVAQGGQFTQPEAQQITGMQPQPQAGPAPGARPMTSMFRDKQSGQYVPFTWNPQTSKWERGQ